MEENRVRITALIHPIIQQTPAQRSSLNRGGGGLVDGRRMEREGKLALWPGGGAFEQNPETGS